MSYRSRIYRQRNPHAHDDMLQQQPFFTKQHDVNKSNQKSAFFQAKLSVNKPGDQYEREADSVANTVVNKSNQTPVIQQKKISTIQRLSTPTEEEKLGTNDARMARDKEIQEKPIQRAGIDPEKEKLKGVQKMYEPKKEENKLKAIQKKEEPMKEEEEKKSSSSVQMKSDSSASTASPQVSSRIESSAGTGNKLPAKTRDEMSSSFGVDFSNVRVHNDSEAENLNQELNAQAFTHGADIYFNSGKYNPENSEGKFLLAHELTHVVQQGTTENNSPQMKLNDDCIHRQESQQGQEEEVNEWVSIPPMSSKGESSFETVFATVVGFEGKTDAQFDGGTGATKNLKARRAKGCGDCGEDDCVSITGTFEITYTVSTTVSLPDMPEGLTPCQQKKVQDVIDNKIAPHEQQHVRAFKTYNGVKRLPINYTGCKDGLQDYLQQLNDSDGIAREEVAKAKSDALDPFFVNVDLDCKD